MQIYDTVNNYLTCILFHVKYFTKFLIALGLLTFHISAYFLAAELLQTELFNIYDRTRTQSHRSTTWKSCRTIFNKLLKTYHVKFIDKSLDIH